MIRLLADRYTEIEALCMKYGVRRFEVFGSAATDSFNDATSDLDFLVEFRAMEPPALADAYFGLLGELRGMFDRNIDLLTPKAIRNPYFRQCVDRTRQLLYAA